MKATPPPYLAKFTPHGFELAFAVLCFAVGLVVFITELVGAGSLSVVQTLPTALVLMWAVELMAAGLCIHIGLLWPSPPVAIGLEKAGLWLAFSGWLIYGLMAFNAAHPPLIAFFITICFVAGCVSRLLALHLLERALSEVPSEE